MITTKSNQGYSLVEISIVLVVVGILGFFSLKFLSEISNQALNQQFKNDLERADNAIHGFILTNGRLPCPDTDNDGDEDCAIANKTGSLPLETLGIESSIQKSRGGAIRYGVYRKENALAKSDTDLSAPIIKNRYEPLLPNLETSNQLNGLDLCFALKTASLAGSDANQVNIGVLGINVAYVIADSGTIDANNDGNLFDSTNASGLKFEKPTASHLNNYDDNVLAVSFNELSGKLNCPKLLSETNGAARASYAAYDMWLIAEQYKFFRDFNVAYLQSLVKVAKASRDLALAGVALAALSAVVAAADVALDFTGASAIGLALSVLATADAAYALVQALQGVADAEQAVVDAQVQQTEAIASLTKAVTFKNNKLAIVKSLDQRGLIR
jgi:prepilin-type N-terminal cleavage/methylation domain-containing protein